MIFVGNNLDILMVSETKTDDAFPESQFLIKGFLKPFRLNCTVKVGSILLYIREDNPCRYIQQTIHLRVFFVESNSRSKKWLFRCLHNHHKNNLASHLSIV